MKKSPCTYTRTSWTNSADGTNRTSRTLHIGEANRYWSARAKPPSPQAPAVPQCGEVRSEAYKDASIKRLVLTNLQVHHGFRVCQWDPQGHEDQVHPQRQRDQCCQGNHALPTKGKVKFHIKLAYILVTFQLEKDKEVS